MEALDDFYLFNIVEDYHELHDQKAAQPERFAQVRTSLLLLAGDVQTKILKSSESPPMEKTA